MPGGFHMSLDPVFNGCNIFLGVFEFVIGLLLVGIDVRGLGSLSRFNWGRP